MLRCKSAILSLALFASATALVTSVAVRAQEFGLGRTPTADEVRRLDLSIPPSGEGLPQGSGTAERGKTVYETQCVRCHGATGREGPQEVLVGGRGSLATAKPLKTVGSYWPYATTLWDYVNRAMPFDRPGTLPPDDVYAVTAYVLQRCRRSACGTGKGFIQTIGVDSARGPRVLAGIWREPLQLEVPALAKFAA
jgi:mono/diheme cytochrome c family protein